MNFVYQHYWKRTIFVMVLVVGFSLVISRVLPLEGILFYVAGIISTIIGANILYPISNNLFCFVGKYSFCEDNIIFEFKNKKLEININEIEELDIDIIKLYRCKNVGLHIKTKKLTMRLCSNDIENEKFLIENSPMWKIYSEIAQANSKLSSEEHRGEKLEFLLTKKDE